MKIYTAGFRKVHEINRYNLPRVQSVITASGSAAENLSAGICYYLITLKGAGGNIVSQPPPHFIIIR